MDNRAVGERIRAIRLGLGDNLREFGERIAMHLRLDLTDGPSASVVYRWEKGISKPNDIRLKAVAELGNITVDNLLYGKDTELETLRKMKVELKNIMESYDAWDISGETVAMLLRELLEEVG